MVLHPGRRILSRRLWMAAAALAPWALLAWAAWLSYWARAWNLELQGPVGLGLQVLRYFLLLTLATLAGATLAPGRRGWAVVPWLVGGLPLLGWLSLSSVPVVGQGGHLVLFAACSCLVFFGLGLTLALLAGWAGRGRAAVLIRAGVALASLALFLGVLGTGVWRAARPVEQRGGTLVVRRARVGPRPGVPWLMPEPPGRDPAGGRALLMDSGGDLLEVNPGRRPWLVRHPGLLPLPSPAEVERLLGPGWGLQRPCPYLFVGARPSGPAEPDCVQVVYEAQAFLEEPGSWTGGSIYMLARLDLGQGRVLESQAISPAAVASWITPETLAAGSGPYTITAHQNYTVEVSGPGVLTRVRSRRNAIWRWAWAQGRLGLAAAEDGELVAVLLPER